MLVIAIKLDHGLRTMVALLERLEAIVEDAFGRINSAIATAQPLVSAVQTLDRRSAVLLEQSLTQVHRTEQRIDNTLETGREKLQQLSQSLDDVFDRMQQATSEIQQAVLRPSSEVAAVAKGIRSGLQTYLKRRVSGQ
ncbi:MAG TPA: hypothetical protein VGL91_18100, partial [Acidobacteriota bacterium]